MMLTVGFLAMLRLSPKPAVRNKAYREQGIQIKPPSLPPELHRMRCNPGKAEFDCWDAGPFRIKTHEWMKLRGSWSQS